MSDLCREAFERHQAQLLNVEYDELRTQFDHHADVFDCRYVAYSDFEKEWGLWQAAWKARQSEIDQLKAQLKLCREENKGLIKSLNDEKKLIDAIKLEVECFESYSEYKYFDENTESAVLMGTMDGFLEGLNKALRGGDQKAEQSETAPVPKWSTIKVVCQRCGHYLNGCHCNHFGDQCPHLNTSMFGDDGLAGCFNCKKIINKDREVVGGVDDINLTR